MNSEEVVVSAPRMILLFVADVDGNAFNTNKYAITQSGDKVQVTLYLTDGESAQILGVPGGMNFTVTEADNTRYTGTYAGATQTVTAGVVEGVVTNAPILPGNLYITKEVVHAHGGEQFPTDHEFVFAVTFVDAEGQPIGNHEFHLENNHSQRTFGTTDGNGVLTGVLSHGETVKIFDIPAGARVTVEEVNLPAKYGDPEPQGGTGS